MACLHGQGMYAHTEMCTLIGGVLLPGDTGKVRAPLSTLTLINSCLLQPNIKFMENKELGHILSEVKFSNVMTNPGLTGSDRVTKGSLIHPGCSGGEPSNGKVQAPVTVFIFLFFCLT